jgi:hypothetical protein
VGERIVDQDTEDLPDPIGVGDRRRLAAAPDLELRPVGAGRRPELRAHLARQLLQVDARRTQLDLVRVEPREVEKVDRELLQALDLAPHFGDELPPLLRVRALGLEQLDEAAQGEDRRPQLVRGVGDELLAGAVEALEPPLHLVEGARELAELVR